MRSQVASVTMKQPSHLNNLIMKNLSLKPRNQVNLVNLVTAVESSLTA